MQMSVVVMLSLGLVESMLDGLICVRILRMLVVMVLEGERHIEILLQIDTEIAALATARATRRQRAFGGITVEGVRETSFHFVVIDHVIVGRRTPFLLGGRPAQSAARTVVLAVDRGGSVRTTVLTAAMRVTMR